ncbi:MAG: CRISPR-associated endonuclease Cas2 [Cetobacterium sp.]
MERTHCILPKNLQFIIPLTSVFEGELTEPLLQKLKLELKQFIRDDYDSLIVFENPQSKKLKKHFWGMIDDKTSNFF